MRSFTVLFLCAAIASTVNASPLSPASDHVDLVRRVNGVTGGTNTNTNTGGGGAAAGGGGAAAGGNNGYITSNNNVYTVQGSYQTNTNAVYYTSTYDQRAYGTYYITQGSGGGGGVAGAGPSRFPQPLNFFPEPRTSRLITHVFETYPAAKPDVPTAAQIKAATGLDTKATDLITPGRSYVKGKTGTNEYLVLSVLGQGEFGAVYLGFAGGKYYAIKMAAPGSYDPEEYTLQKSLGGLEATSKVDCVVKTVEEVQTSTAQGFVLELANGGNLQSLINVSPNGIEESLAQKLFLQLAEGLVKIHASGVTIRDIKPSNILVFNDNTGKPQKVKFSDFGLAKKGEVISRFMPPNFNRPPEFTFQLTKHNPADIFQMGLTLYLMLLGPRDGVPRSDADGTVNFADPAWVAFAKVYPKAAPILTKLLSADPLLRPTTTLMAQMVKDWKP